MPSSYVSAIGQFASDLSHNASYKPLIQDGFQSTSVPQAQLEYRFSGDFGWNVGFALYFVSGSGQANVATVLPGATGLDLSLIEQLLSQAGQQPILHDQINMTMGEIHGGYTWKLYDHVGLQANMGFAKVLSSSASFSSNNSTVDSNSTVQGLYSSASQQVTSILSSYGYAPTVSLALRVSF